MKTATPTLAHRVGALRTSAASANPIERAMEGFAARVLRSRLALLQHGQVTLVEGGRHETFGRASERCALHCTVHVRDRRFFAEVAFGGSVGAGESFMAGDWWTDDLTALVRILLVNREVLEGLDSGFSRLSEIARRLLHATARNTRTGSRRNIAAHYDIGNDFFERMLDPSMMYSCAFFERADMDLQQAQIAKLDRLCCKLDLQPGDHLLEIGTGWGALAIHAASRYGCRVTTTTISREQHALATERVRAAGLQDRITVLERDYRDLEGRYDKLVSVEMIEAVGHQYFDAFFRRCGELLAPGGTMVLQSITIADAQYEAARDSVDFIKRHIFPGCCIPSVGALVSSAARASALRVVDLEDIGPHYARTLALWRENLFANADALRARGYPDALLRMFDFYLSYCEGGFAERALGDVQFVLQDASRAVAPTPRV
ncbi:class I SAM-dependent methyltransferase [Ramlibacter ginsenosidimutans]|uniref:Class I SAM-dependent methyltransferase n=1 Tax=Ramlibacter ginsenosidimutans TaxID=502333 RepID=A0A934TXE1_9BURK|nr:cyclopropane-fatty-acyl-phospholipid synthase family protein [Ramlibacter ginsenosidimutans]MBK6008392.1 class I SAM-dependent methyltransferase [Ramlibacter ginsenosidimutans]